MDDKTRREIEAWLEIWKGEGYRDISYWSEDNRKILKGIELILQVLLQTRKPDIHAGTGEEVK